MASHRSRLCGASIDVPTARYPSTIGFWRSALDREARADDDDPDYVSFGDAAPGVEVFVQAIGDPSGRIHLDIETDDIDAEVARLVALGATEVERINTWVVMRDPVGILFCVVRVQSPESFEAHARTWQH